MDEQKRWQPVADEAQFTPLGQNLPTEADVGDQEIERDSSGYVTRKWVYVEIRYGSGSWAYWLDRGRRLVCADTLWNPNAAHFAGFLAKPHVIPTVSREWLLTDPQVSPKPSHPLYIEDIERSEGRYERNDVDRIVSIPKPEAKS